ncbi:Protein of unknown function (DUF3515) [Goodfellowiella coeruleoviolacea]|uniref:DUF3515 domain-containing protein n=2 Tax=Goodfellowiella coeruleoviolacea TaxID=334858 RepID=A0AAE3KK93_9PSEU|nr:Protein of unknown function (DUF3515) [Goodfellowiella coeruleoviolacea]
MDQPAQHDQHDQHDQSGQHGQHGQPEERPAGPSLPRPLLAVIIGLPVLLAVGVAAMGLVLGNGSSAEQDNPAATGPVALGPVPAPAAESAECTALLNGLPQQLVSNGVAQPRRELATPAPAGAMAWGTTQQGPVILRCGLDRPTELTPTSGLREVSGVRWLVVEGADAATWYVVDRPVYVALTVPNDAGTGPLQDVSEAVRTTLPAVGVRTSG